MSEVKSAAELLDLKIEQLCELVEDVKLLVAESREPECLTRFTFHDGQAKRTVDPMVVFRILRRHPTFVWDQHPKEIARDHNAEKRSSRPTRLPCWSF